MVNGSQKPHSNEPTSLNTSIYKEKVTGTSSKQKPCTPGATFVSVHQSLRSDILTIMTNLSNLTMIHTVDSIIYITQRDRQTHRGGNNSLHSDVVKNHWNKIE